MTGAWSGHVFDRPRLNFERPFNYEAFALSGDGRGGQGSITFTTASGATVAATVVCTANGTRGATDVDSTAR